jgi:hypothetical protein
MLLILQLTAVLLVAVTMALTLAHALELPGKLRLSKKEYLAVQPIYYPGFTFGGAAEPLGILVLAVLLFFLTGVPFWLAACALVLLVAGHAIYWIVTHPVNNFWLRDVELKGAGKTFFERGTSRRSGGAPVDWVAYRDRWEYSHVTRAVLAFLSLALLVTAVAL